MKFVKVLRAFDPKISVTFPDPISTTQIYIESMGNTLGTCARDYTSKSPKDTKKKSALPVEKNRTAEDEISELSVSPPDPPLLFDMRDDPVTNTVQRDVNDSKVVLSQAFDQIFLLCESGVASTVQFIFDSHPGVEMLINDRQECLVTDTKLLLTPLQLGAACGHPEIIKTLCRSSFIQVNIADPLFFMTALHLAVHLGQTFAVEALCADLRVEVNEKNVEGKTAMHLAVENGYPAIVETILRLRPTTDLRVKDFDGNNVLHLAAYHPNARIMKQLVDHTSLVSLYCDYFDATKDSSKMKPKNKRQIFETQNLNGETAVRILLNAIRRIQQKHSNKEALLAHQAELEELAQANASAAKTNQSANISGVPPLQLLQPDGESVEMMTAERHSPGLGNLPATITSAETTDEISEAPTIKAMEAMEVELPHIQAPEAADAGNTSKIVVPVSGGGGARTVSSIDPSPELRERGDEEEDQDIDVLIECLEILNDATQVSPSQESMSSFGYHSACERRSSFDLDSDATDAGEEEGQQEDPEGDGSENGGGGGGGRDKDQNRAAYSWSPAATPSLDQLDPYFTPKAAPKTPKTPKSVHSE